MIKRIKRWIAVGIALGVMVTGAGCALDRQLPISSGYYQNLEPYIKADMHAPPLIEGVRVERDRGRVVFFLRKGENLAVDFMAREKRRWPAGCPGNLFSQRMEVLDLHPGPEAAEILPFADPVLVRDCPREPVRLVLRGDGEMGGAAAACPHPEPCLTFISAPRGAPRSNCPELEVALEELQRQQAALADWSQDLVDGYGPGVWYFGEGIYPAFHHRIDRVSVDIVVAELNDLLEEDGLPLVRVKTASGRVVEVQISDDRQLTQGMGSTGAQSYLKVVTYSLTSLPELDCVDFQFSPGDHAQPGLRCRR